MKRSPTATVVESKRHATAFNYLQVPSAGTKYYQARIGSFQAVRSAFRTLLLFLSPYAKNWVRQATRFIGVQIYTR
jgi:hypothetical protein